MNWIWFSIASDCVVFRLRYGFGCVADGNVGQVSEGFEEEANGVDQEAAQGCKIRLSSVCAFVVWITWCFVELNYEFGLFVSDW